MNFISEEKMIAANELAVAGFSHREIAERVGIAKGTAYHIWKTNREVAIEMGHEVITHKGGYWYHRGKRRVR